MIGGLFLLFCIVQIIGTIILFLSKRIWIRRIAAYLVVPLLFVSYIFGTINFWMNHPDEKLSYWLFDKKNRFSYVTDEIFIKKNES